MLPTRSIGELRAALESGAHPRLAKSSRPEKQAWIESFVRECGYADLNREERGVARAYIQAVTGYSRAQMTRYVGAIVPKAVVTAAIKRDLPNVGRFYGVVSLTSLMLLGIVVSLPRSAPAFGSLAFLNAESTVPGVAPLHAERSIVVTTDAGGTGNGDVLFAMERTQVRADRPFTALVAAANPGELRLRVQARRQARINRVQSPIGGRGEQLVDDSATANGADFFAAIGSGLNGQVLTVKNGKIVWAYPNFSGTGRSPTPENNGNDSDPSNDDRPPRRGGGGGGGGSESTGGTTTNTTVYQTIDSDEWTDATGVVYLTDASRNVGIGTTAPAAKLEVVGSISGSSLKLAGLANCNTIDTDAAGNLICGTDEGGVAGSTEIGTASFSGGVLRLADARYVNQSGDTMTGALAIDLSGTNAGIGLEVIETISGSILFANRGLSTSGSFVWEETASGASLYVASSINGAGLVDCDLSSQALKWDAATGRFSCGTVSTGNWSGTGALQTAFDARYVNQSGDTMTGALTIDLASVTSGVGLEVIETISGSTIYANRSLSTSGSLAWEGAASGASLYVASSLNGAGLVDCDIAGTSKLLWDSTTGRFSCGTDADTDTNTTYAAGKGLALNGTSFSLNSTITGALVRFNTVSGSTIYAQSLLAASGSLAVDGTASFNSSAPLKLTDAGFFGCTALETDADGDIVCGSDADTDTNTTYTAGQGLTLNGTSISLNATITGSLLRFQTVSGSTLFAQSALASSGTLAVDGAASFNAGVALTAFTNCTALETDGNGTLVCGSDGGGSAYTAGQGLTLNGTAFSVNGTLTGSLAEYQTLSGGTVFANRGLSTSGSFVWEGAASGASLYVASSFEGAGLVDCDLSSQTLQWDATTKRFSCGTDDSSGSGLGQNEGDLRYVNQSGDTMTGALTIDLASVTSGVGLEVLETISGAHLYASNSLTTSGTLLVEGSSEFNGLMNAQGGIYADFLTANQDVNALSYSGATMYLSTSFRGAGLSDCTGSSNKLTWDASSGTFTCSTDETGGSSFTAGQGLALNGSVLVLNSTISGSLLEFQTVSGSTVYASKALRSSGSLVWEGAGSGASLYIGGTFEGAGLSDCDADNQTLHWDATTGRFSCGDDDTGGSSLTAGQGLALNGSVLVLNSTITGSLLEFQTVSGALVYAKNTLASSGSLVWEGAASGNTLTVSGQSSLFGNVGIGISNPATALHVRKNGDNLVSTTAYYNVYAQDANGQRGVILGYDTSGTIGIIGSSNDNSSLAFWTAASGTWAEKMRLTSAGNLGIGTTDATSKLEVVGTASGTVFYAKDLLRSSGSLAVDGTSYFNSSAPLKLTDAGFFGCTALETDADGDIVCGSDGGTAYTAGQGLSLNGTVLTLNSTITGSLLEFQTVSGSTIFVGQQLSVSGSVTLGEDIGDSIIFNGDIHSNMVPNMDQVFDIGNSSFRWNNIWATHGNISTSFSVLGTSSFTGNVGIGSANTTTKAALSVSGVASGTTLYATRSFSGAGLSDCDADNQTLHWDASTGRFSCGDDDTGGSSGIQDHYVLASGDTMTGALQLLNTMLNVTGSGTFSGYDTADVVLTVRGASGQTGNLQEWRDGNDSLVLLVDGGGLLSGSSAQFSGNFVAQGNVTLGSDNTDVITFNGDLMSDISPDTNDSYNLGNSTNRWSSAWLVSANLAGDMSVLGNASIGGSTADNIAFNGLVNTSFNPESNISYSLGNSSNRWNTGWFGNANISSDLAVLGTSALYGNVGIGSSAATNKAALNIAGIASGTTLYATKSFSGAGLSDCDADNQTLHWDATTGRFSCGDDDSGSSLTAGQGLALNGSVLVLNSTITGSLLEFQTVSGALVFANNQLSVSGSTVLGDDSDDNIVFNADVNSNIMPNANNSFDLGSSGARWSRLWANGLNVSADVSVLGVSSLTGNVGIGSANTTNRATLSVSGIASGTTLYATKSFSGAGLSDCDADNQTLHWDATTGRFSCGDDDSGSSLTAGQGLALNGSVLVLNSTITGSLLEFQTVSGALVYAKNTLASSGSLVWEGAASGKSLFVSGTTTLYGNVGIGHSSSAEAALEVLGTVSGSIVYVTDHIAGPNSTIDIAGHVVPTIDGFFTLGTVDKEWFHTYSNWGTFSMGLGIGTEDSSSQAKLEVGGTASGRVLFANDALRSSGALVWEGTASGKSLFVSGTTTLYGNASMGTILGTNSSYVSIGTRNANNLLGNNFEFHVASGLEVDGVAYLDGGVEVLGTVSGSALTINGGGFFRGGNGDVNGDGSATAFDLLTIINYFNGGGATGLLTPEQYQRADTNGDGRVDKLDYDAIDMFGILDAADNAVVKHLSDTAWNVDMSGNFGIGTTAPNEKLDVIGTISGAALTVNGNVGIGIAASDTTQALHILGATPVALIEDSGGNGASVFLKTTDRQWNLSNDSSGNFQLYDATQTATRFLVDSNGNVSIGHASPDEKLDVLGTISGSALKVANSVYVGKATGAGKIIAEPPAVQTVTGGATITDDACGTVKELNAGSSVTTNTTNTFTAPSAANAGCVMYVVNIDTVDTITLDFNSNFKTYAGIDVSLTALDGVIVASNGTTWYQVSYIANNNDLAEWIPYAGAKPQPGDVLAIADDEESVEISSSPYDAKIIGVVSTAPGLLMGHDGDDSVPLALAGRVPVKVTGEGGPIAPGDLLTSSSTPGHAMKATRGGPTVGKALAAFDGNGTGSVLAFVNVASYGPAMNAFEIVSGSGTAINAVGTAAQMVFTSTDADNRALVVLDSEETTATQDLLVITSDVGSDENTVFKVTADGNAYSDEAFNSAGADYAEWFRASTNDLKPGDVVCVDVTQSNTVKRCDQDGDGNVMGIVSTNPAFIGNSIGGAQGLTPPGYALIGLIGQVPAKVRVENGGAIRAGDSLTAASVPGYARKAAAGESTVGVALEPLESGEGVVNVLISRRNQSLTVSAIEQKVLDQIQAMEIGDEVELMVAEAMGDLDVAQSIVDEVTRQVESLNVPNVVEEEVSRQVAQLREELAGQATDTGSILTNASDLAASTLQLSASLSVEGDARIVGDLHLDGALVTNDLFVPGVLAVDGSLTSSTMNVTGDAAVHGTLTLHGPVVLGSGASLQFGSGLTLNDLIVERSLAVLGDITVEGMARFLGTVAIEGELVVARQAGHLRVPLGATGATFAFVPPFAGTPVVTASPNKPVLYAVSVATSTGFTVSLAEPAASDITFSWVALIIPGTPEAIAETPSGMAFPVDETGTPVSSSLQWNACLRGVPLFDASGVPFSCSRYHDGNTWHQPDLNISFVWNDAVTPPYMQLPDGYVPTVTETSASVRAAITEVNAQQQPAEEPVVAAAPEPEGESVETPSVGTGAVVVPEQPVVEEVVIEPAETPVEPTPVEESAEEPVADVPVVDVPTVEEGVVVELAPEEAVTVE